MSSHTAMPPIPLWKPLGGHEQVYEGFDRLRIALSMASEPLMREDRRIANLPRSTMATCEQILAELEALPRTARAARMVELGKRPALQSAIKELWETHGFYGKSLAIDSCWGSKNVELASESLSSTSTNVREAATRVILSIGDDEAVQQVQYGVPCMRANANRSRPIIVLSTSLSQGLRQTGRS